ncbi:transporter, auxin efflux carrier (AEC) family protein [Fusobacterium gonidiaformans 3-1-5R]|uniref:Transporter, auxin efflux carrier (AEC) family protein n=1 Tax=Fusobacterium gonidiaformans 3-1-5R TaxID=469605 RepID=E5BFT0_9FUSO|nr:AEC family transporter [Fusobacterium gonidiaformans]EFS20961.1 transporter, auxin efflux carrier (AEC) family protein [Fusobacterium gonidiaformans 3-1-5R]
MQTVLFPVFFMLFLGYLARKKEWITTQQNEGGKKIVFNILFPILVFHVLAQSELKKEFLIQILFLFFAWSFVFLVGKAMTRFTGKRFSNISPYLLLTCEGGNVALPLYISLVGAAHAVNIVTFDVAGILINFGLVPILVTKQSSSELIWKSLLKKIFTSSFILAVLIGILFNVTGLYSYLMNSTFQDIYLSTIDIVLKPITGIILFTLGYELKLNRAMLQPLWRLSLLRLLTCSGIIGTFFLFFPNLMKEEVFSIAVFLYFMCPTGFPVPLQIQALVKEEEEEHFMSAFISVFLMIALAVYTIITLVWK